MFHPDTGPAFLGNARPAVHWVCAQCGTILLKNVHERQFLDVLFRCPKCTSLSGSPERMPGEPIPAMTVLTPPGRYRLASAVNVGDKPVPLAGEPAVAGYVKETGARYGDLHQAPASRLPSELNAAALRSLAADMVGLLGERYEPLDAADQRGLRSSTPPARRHRLIELIKFAEDAAQRLESGAIPATIDLDGDALAELVTTVSVFDRWQHHPAYARIVSSLPNGDAVQHAVTTLLVASYLVDAGNGVGIVDDDGLGGRIPDIWVRPTLIERLDLEVKSPLALRAPVTLPSEEEAARIIERQLDEAASSKRGQLSPDHSGIVAIGTFHMGQGGLDVLERATRLVLEQQRERKRHVAAVLLCEVSYQTTTEIDDVGAVQRTFFTPTMDHRLVYHPGYSGALRIAEGTPWSSWRENRVLEQKPTVKSETKDNGTQTRWS